MAATRATDALPGIIVTLVLLNPLPLKANDFPYCHETIHLVQPLNYTAWFGADCAAGDYAYYSRCWDIELLTPSRMTFTLQPGGNCPGHLPIIMIDGNTVLTAAPGPNEWGTYGCSSGCGLSYGGGTFAIDLTCTSGNHYYLTAADLGIIWRSFADVNACAMCPPPLFFSWTLTPLQEVTSAPPADLVLTGDPTHDGQNIATLVRSNAISPSRATGASPATITSDMCPPLSDADVDAMIEPYLSVNYNVPTVTFDATSATAAGVPSAAVARGQALVAANNQVLTLMNQQVNPWVHYAVDPWYYPNSTPEERGDGNPCGNWANPLTTPVPVPSNLCFASHEAAVADLVSKGFHRVNPPFGGISQQMWGNDYAHVVDYPPCPTSGAFRLQAHIHKLSNCCWSYDTQGPEPNPEFLDFANQYTDIPPWPYDLWPLYVWWWHYTH
jgi:hypothetical protein